jgi:hypothetical protein
MTFDCDDYRGLVQSTGCTVSTPNSVAPNNNLITSLRGLNSAENVSDIPNSTQIIKVTSADTRNKLSINANNASSTKTPTSVNSKYLQYAEALSYKQAITHSDKNEWHEATYKMLQFFPDLQAMFAHHT